MCVCVCVCVLQEERGKKTEVCITQEDLLEALKDVRPSVQEKERERLGKM